MPENTEKILQTWEKTLPLLSDEKKAYFLAYSEGVAAMAAKTVAQEQQPAAQSQTKTA